MILRYPQHVREMLAIEGFYLAGPMSSSPNPNCNYEQFHEVTRKLREMYVPVFNPAELTVNPGEWERSQYLAIDLQYITSPNCVGVLCLPDWRTSAGARLEVHTALEFGKGVYELTDIDRVVITPVYDFEPAPVETISSPEAPAPRVSALQRAHSLIYGERQGVYDHPWRNFQRMAERWNGILRAKGVLAYDRELSRWDIPEMMSALKWARLDNDPMHTDSVVDAAGYAGTYEMLMEWTEKELAKTAEQTAA